MRLWCKERHLQNQSEGGVYRVVGCVELNRCSGSHGWDGQRMRSSYRRRHFCVSFSSKLDLPQHIYYDFHVVLLLLDIVVYKFSFPMFGATIFTHLRFCPSTRPCI